MRRISCTLALIALAGLGLAGCAASDGPEAGSAPPAPTRTEQHPGATAPDDTQTATPQSARERADALCDETSRSGDLAACILTDRTITGDLEFTAQKVVKLVRTSVEGAVKISGSREAVITDSTITGSLSVADTDGVVVKTSKIGGSLALADGRHATVVKNTIAGDLGCSGFRGVNGTGNAVTGTATGQCARLG